MLFDPKINAFKISKPDRQTVLQVDVLAGKWLSAIQFDQKLTSEDRANRRKAVEEFVAWVDKQVR